MQHSVSLLNVLNGLICKHKKKRLSRHNRRALFAFRSPKLQPCVDCEMAAWIDALIRVAADIVTPTAPNGRFYRFMILYFPVVLDPIPDGNTQVKF